MTEETKIVNYFIGRNWQQFDMNPDTLEKLRESLSMIMQADAQAAYKAECGEIDLTTDEGLERLNRATLAALAVAALGNVDWDQIGDPDVLTSKEMSAFIAYMDEDNGDVLN